MATPELEGTSGALVGRERERAAIDRLLEASSRGESSSLVLNLAFAGLYGFLRPIVEKPMRNAAAWEGAAHHVGAWG